ncbi:unnamed protein product, partial [Ranitomeya imitator]
GQCGLCFNVPKCPAGSKPKPVLGVLKRLVIIMESVMMDIRALESAHAQQDLMGRLVSLVCQEDMDQNLATAQIMVNVMKA